MLRMGLILLIFPMVVLIGGYFSEMSEVNACIRERGSFDYLRMQCDLNAKHPFIPYFQRHPLLVNGSMDGGGGVGKA